MLVVGKLKLRVWAPLLGVLILAATAPRANASVTIGQLAPGSPPAANCVGSPFDDVNPVVGSGNPYVMPANGTIISWTTNAASATGQQLKMKVFRRLNPDNTSWLVVGHDGPRNLTPNGTTGNTFPANVPVKAGDVLGLSDGNASGAHPIACDFPLTGSMQFESTPAGDPPDGAQETFTGPFAVASNITAQLVIDNRFGLGAIALNKKKGTATLTVDLPNPGDLTGSGNGANVASSGARAVISKAVGSGPATLLIKARGKKKRKLNDTGKVKLNVAITYIPTGGDPSAQSVKVKLKKKL